MYKCVVFFSDLHDKSFEYRPGDIFPRSGLKVSPERLEELSTNKNRRGIPLIVKVEEQAPETKEVVEEITEPPKMAKPKRRKKNAD